jgi:hypothetical protein
MSAAPMRVCWSCDTRIPRAERYCERCGADQWNPPQGTNVSSHSWRTNDYVRTESKGGPLSAQAITAAGVVIIATLMLLASWFWLAIWLFGVVNPPEAEEFLAVEVLTLDDYLSSGRVFLAVVASTALTVATWAIALNIVGNE